MNFSIKSKGELFRKATKFITVVEHWNIFRLQVKYGISADLFLLLNQTWLKQAGIKTIVDIGAHTGTWARTIHHLLPNARIYSFEPIPASFNLVMQRMQGISVHKAFNVALGDKSGKEAFNMNDFSPASSFCAMSESHKKAFPFTSETNLIMVNIERLDDILLDYDLEKNIFIKVDVQGFEDKVINGGRETFRKAKIILIEVSFERLYDGQPLFEDIYSQLLELDFRYAGCLDQLLDPKNGNVLQADAIFMNNSMF